MENNEKRESKFSTYLKSIGPGAIIAAAIIGPGTVTTASVQGSTYRYESIWILCLAVILAYLFQEPAIRLTITKKVTIMEGVRDNISPLAAKFLYLTILVGSIAFQAGNFAGAGMALNYFVPQVSITAWALSMSLLALIAAWTGAYKLLENINKVLIFVMVIAFVLTAFVAGPDIGLLLSEGFSFKIPGGDYLLVLALIATTMTPNLVLALSSFLKRKYNDVSIENSKESIKLAKFDLRTNMVITFLITGAIVVSAGTVIFGTGTTVNSAGEMAAQLTPLLGRYAGILFSLGLWAAAFSSGLYQISLHPMLFGQACNRTEDVKDIKNRTLMVLASVLPVLIVWMFGATPISIIIAAQALNGLALPFVAILVWIICNKEKLMGEVKNNLTQNISYGIVVVIVLILAVRVFLSLFKII